MTSRPGKTRHGPVYSVMYISTFQKKTIIYGSARKIGITRKRRKPVHALLRLALFPSVFHSSGW